MLTDLLCHLSRSVLLLEASGVFIAIIAEFGLPVIHHPPRYSSPNLTLFYCPYYSQYILTAI